MDIEEILKLDDGDEVSELHGEVTKVFDQNSGKRGKRKWTVQNFMLEDEAGEEIKVGAWNMDDLSELEGQTITLKRDMHFKDQNGYQSVELGENTKIIEEDAAPKSTKSPSRGRKSGARETRKTTNDKTAGSSDRNDRIYWQTCLKVAGLVATGNGTEVGDLITYARELFNSRPGAAPQNKVRKLVKHESDREDADPHRSDGTPRTSEGDDNDDDEVDL